VVHGGLHVVVTAKDAVQQPEHRNTLPNRRIFCLENLTAKFSYLPFIKLEIIFRIEGLYKMQLERAREVAVDIISGRDMVCVSDTDRLTKTMKFRKLFDL